MWKSTWIPWHRRAAAALRALAPLLLLAACLAQTTRPRSGTSTNSGYSPFLRWGGGPAVAGNCLQLDSTGAAVAAAAPCGTGSGGGGGTGGGSSFTFVDEEIPSGAVDGNNRVFTLANTPATGSLKLYRNGIRLHINDDFTLSGRYITFVVSLQPVPGDIWWVEYRY